MRFLFSFQEYKTCSFLVKVAYLPLIYGPAALSHEYVDKSASMENVLCVGRSGSFDPVHDFMDENNDKNLIVRRQRLITCFDFNSRLYL